jgi:hypothetical protein
MDSETKIIVSIETKGAKLRRAGTPIKIGWFITNKDLNPKGFKKNKGVKVIKRGQSRHYPLVQDKVIQHIKLTKECYQYMITTPIAPYNKKGTWNNLTNIERITSHANNLASTLNGKVIGIDILED